jgi:hypothetical protein
VHSGNLAIGPDSIPQSQTLARLLHAAGARKIELPKGSNVRHIKSLLNYICDNRISRFPSLSGNESRSLSQNVGDSTITIELKRNYSLQIEAEKEWKNERAKKIAEMLHLDLSPAEIAQEIFNTIVIYTPEHEEYIPEEGGWTADYSTKGGTHYIVIGGYHNHVPEKTGFDPVSLTSLKEALTQVNIPEQKKLQIADQLRLNFNHHSEALRTVIDHIIEMLFSKYHTD